MPIFWNGYLIALSVFVAFFGAFSTLSHVENMRESTGRAAFLWMISGAVTLGVAVWSMHFIGMLAFHLPIAIAYDFKLTLFSIIPAIAGTLAGFVLIQNQDLYLKRLVSAGVVMGLGIAAMHYTGMAALKMQPAINYDPLIFLASILIAIIAATGALLIAFGDGTKKRPLYLKQQVLGAMVMGGAVAAMHYTAMAGANFSIDSFCAVNGTTIDRTLLALIVTCLVMLLFSAGSLASLLERGIVLERLRQAHASLKMHSHQLQQVEDKLSGILDSIPMVIWSVTPTHELLYMNPAADYIYGRPVADFVADRTMWSRIVHPDDYSLVMGWLSRVLVGEPQTLEYRIVRPSGEIRWLEDRARTVRDKKGNTLRLDGVATDISERKASDERIEYLASYDDLTGLPNRNFLITRLQQALMHARRSGRKLALLFLNIDRFKSINDNFGHSFGDNLLKEFADRLTSILRAGETLARMGSDEFVIILEDIREPESAGQLALRVLKAFELPLSSSGHDLSLSLSMSIGVSIYPEDGDDPDVLLKHADVAMYLAKDQEGGNCFQCYTPEMGNKVIEKVRLEHALHHALQNDEFVLHYQPQIDLKTGHIKSVEALIRWNNPELGFIAPGYFIPIAEKTGLIIPIGEWVLKTACAQVSAWLGEGFQLTVAVNVSSRQLQQKNMPLMVQSVLANTGLAPACLELELTESMLMNDSEATIGILHQLKTIGVKMSIDDFGTGFSSLSYLTRFPIDIIKIDQSFIANLDKKPEAASIILTVIALANALGLKNFAEGVETAEQLEFLRANGCDAIQGYYFSRPLPAHEMRALLRLGASLDLGKIACSSPALQRIRR
ncbi:EAL domain-containing protein [Glaciimonas sp. GG7]